MIRFACPGCESVFTVGDEKAGKTGKCPKCEARFQIPDAEDGPSAAPSQPEPPSVPPPSPLNADPSEAVEIQPCPGCNARLSVTRADLGADVECPYCQAVYQAVDSAAPAPRPSGSGTRSKLRAVVEEEPAAPSRRRRQPEPEEDDDERPVRRSRGRMSAEEDDEEDEPPVRRRKSRSRDDDDEDYDDRPRRKSRGRSRRRSSGGAVGSGWVLTAAIVNVVYAVLTLSCSGCGLAATGTIAATLSKAQQQNVKISNDPRQNQELAERNRDLAKAENAITFIMVVLVTMLLIALLMIGASVGFFMKKKFGTYMGVAAIGLIVIMNVGGLIAPFALGLDPDFLAIAKSCGGTLFYYGTYVVLTGLGIMKGGHLLD